MRQHLARLGLQPIAEVMAENRRHTISYLVRFISHANYHIYIGSLYSKFSKSYLPRICCFCKQDRRRIRYHRDIRCLELKKSYIPIDYSLSKLLGHPDIIYSYTIRHIRLPLQCSFWHQFSPGQSESSLQLTTIEIESITIEV